MLEDDLQRLIVLIRELKKTVDQTVGSAERLMLENRIHLIEERVAELVAAFETASRKH